RPIDELSGWPCPRGGYTARCRRPGCVLAGRKVRETFLAVDLGGFGRTPRTLETAPPYRLSVCRPGEAWESLSPAAVRDSARRAGRRSAWGRRRRLRPQGPPAAAPPRNWPGGTAARPIAWGPEWRSRRRLSSGAALPRTSPLPSARALGPIFLCGSG